jgi:hypothetical protein
MLIPLYQIAYARSGDKGANANVGVIAYNSQGYTYLKEHLTSERVHAYFLPLGVRKTVRYELPTLEALNFVLEGGSVSLRVDSQGKALGQALLQMTLDIPEAIASHILREVKK